MWSDWKDYYHENLSSPWIHLAISAAVGMFVGLLAASIVKMLARRSQTQIFVKLANSLRSVFFIIGILLGINFGLQAFELRPDTLDKIDNAFTFGIFIIFTWALTNLYASIHEHYVVPWGQKSDNSTLVDVGYTVANTSIWLIGLISGLSSAGLNVSAVLAGLGIGGLALALAAQDAVSNIFGGIIVLTQAPFKVGDRIKVAGQDGWVKSIGIRSTVITNWYGHRITVPNKVFTGNDVSNVDARNEYWEEIQLKLRHDTTTAQIETVMERVRAILKAHKDLRDTIWVGVSKLGDGFVQVEVWYGVISYLRDGGSEGYPNEYDKNLMVKSEIHMSVLRALEEEDIRLATPVATHIVHQGPLQKGRF